MFEELEMELESQEQTGYEVLDGCYGTVTGCCRKGAFLQLDNGEEAFAYKFAHLLTGTKVLCTVRRLADEGRRMLVTIDSVPRPAYV